MKHAVAWMLVVALLAGMSVACNEGGGDADTTATAPSTPNVDIPEPTPSEAVMQSLANQIGTGDRLESQWALVLWELNESHPTWLCVTPTDLRGRIYTSFADGYDLDVPTAPLTDEFQNALDLDDDDNWVYAPGLVGGAGFMLIAVNAKPLFATDREFIERTHAFDGHDYRCVAPTTT
ncbi:MAG: hypothetical protein WEE64_03000 [Dehalococcoidia bacterium]